MLAYRAGKCPNLDDFIRQYPQLADQLRDVIDALILLEQNAPGRAQFEATHTRVPFSARVPREIDDFVIVREIGRGGMGVVYEAVQQSLGRPVALKVLSAAGLLSPIQLERFRLEARSAAQLHHNHIVPVYGVGEHNGVHFYAMQFIHGQNLNQVIEALRELRGCVDVKKPELTARNEFTQAISQGLVTGNFAAGVDGADVSNGVNSDRQPLSSQAAPRSPLTTSRSSNEFTTGTYGRPFYESVARVGLEVADALAYAHGEGVLHRDIKPSNLLLDGKGSVWITDFGLAKTEGTDGLTQTGDFVGTLRYMAPERLEGWSDRRSDIYSLGATLYELLTLRSYFEGGSRAQMIDRIVHEQPTPPTKIDPSIPRDLETIVIKAIAKEPSARYRTADEMAEDLRRYLSDRPILARRSTRTERFVRWCRRNPLVATLATSVMAALTIGLAATSYFAASASREAKNVKAALALAEEQTKHAQTNFWRASIAIRELMTKLASQNDVPQAVRMRFSDEAVKYFETLSQEKSPDPSLQYESAVGYRSLAMLHQERGESDMADKCYRRAIAVLIPLVADHATNQQYRQQLGYAYYRYGVLHISLGRFQESQDVLSRGESIYEKLLAETPDSYDYAFELAGLLKSSMGSHSSVGQFNEAEKAYRRAAEIFERLIDGRSAADPYPAGNPSGYVVTAFGNLQREWAHELAVAGRLADSERIWRDVVTTLGRAHREHPDIVEHSFDLANAHGELSRIAAQQNRIKEAKEEQNRAIKICSEVIATEPAKTEAFIRRGQCYLDQGEFDKAMEDVSTAIKLKPDFKDKPTDRAEVGHLLWKIGDAKLSKEQKSDARKVYEQSLKCFEDLAANYPKERFYRQETAFSHRNVAQAHAASGELSEAAAHLRQAGQLYEGLVAEEPGSSWYKQEVAYSYALLAERLKDNKQNQQAIEACHRAAELNQSLWEISSTDQDVRNAAGNYEWVGQLLRKLGQLDEAEQNLHKALSLWTKLVDKTNIEDHRFHLGCSYEELGHVYSAQQRLEKSIDAYRHALDVWTKLVAEFNNPDRRNHLSWTQEWIVDVLILQARRAETNADLTESQQKTKAQEFRTQASNLLRDAIKEGPQTAQSANDIAWHLVTNPELDLRDLPSAVELAQKAASMEPNNGKYWNTLGAAQYRAGNWQIAITSLDKSIELQRGGNAWDYFFLAMSHQRLDKPDEARKWYDKGVEWTKTKSPKNEELRRIQVEASKTLDIAQPKSPNGPSNKEVKEKS